MLSPKLTFRDYTTKVGKTLANVKAMDKVKRLGMPVHQ
ncbi:hypothetical protein BTN49_1938 [Candidatus Enterovibrio escicola]|uniref:Mobile element protein n=1 Tax=Candidatus Enterovibrio escicola TaxID=1927127 RepID=A0A2A5T2L9_9GAMM|nr:hypothetical protein BTN49_1938 [Candidatus Enterovibrio escacola]